MNTNSEACTHNFHDVSNRCHGSNGWNQTKRRREWNTSMSHSDDGNDDEKQRQLILPKTGALLLAVCRVSKTSKICGNF